MRIAAIASLGLLGVAQALPKISRTGKYLYDPQGARFYIKVGQARFGIRQICAVCLARVWLHVCTNTQGVAYQPQGQLAPESAANAEK
jgi:hypothetical protein